MTMILYMIYKKNDDYLIYVLGDNQDQYDFNINKHQLHLFLTHLFYNNLLLTY